MNNSKPIFTAQQLVEWGQHCIENSEKLVARSEHARNNEELAMGVELYRIALAAIQNESGIPPAAPVDGERVIQAIAEFTEEEPQISGLSYFAFSPENGHIFFTTRESAILHAEQEIQLYRDDISDGWDEDVRRVGWGIVMQQAQGFDAMGKHTSDPAHTYQTCDYRLEPKLKKAENNPSWGAPKTVGQLISQLRTFDPKTETTAVLRMREDFRDGKHIRQVPLSMSMERFDGPWLSDYKGTGRKVLTFWGRPHFNEGPGNEITVRRDAGRSRENFLALCNRFWNWAEMDLICADDKDYESRQEWDGNKFTHRITEGMWRIYKAAPSVPEGWLMIPANPSPEHLNSVATRYRHDFGIMSEREREGCLTIARQMYSECSGQGFYTVQEPE